MKRHHRLVAAAAGAGSPPLPRRPASVCTRTKRGGWNAAAGGARHTAQNWPYFCAQTPLVQRGACLGAGRQMCQCGPPDWTGRLRVRHHAVQRQGQANPGEQRQVVSLHQWVVCAVLQHRASDFGLLCFDGGTLCIAACEIFQHPNQFEPSMRHLPKPTRLECPLSFFR